ncbi:DUF177 domain-containing protein [uncultured Sphingomonas sp.]|uniref:DUF177 domain-containing protein n=1 Tax=unclassified Sphingomonas TaxID=196159 RepID=UPI0025ED2B8D|nr:DUF177 domain-containing protein [uncultured Sphingomonas sp.]
MTPEFSRPVRLDTIGEAPRVISVEADAAERAALATRFGLPEIARLAGEFTVRRDAAGILVEGRVTGAVTQACSITGDPLPATVDEAITLRFVEEGEEGEEIELDGDAIDVLPIEGGAIDLGEAAAETLALSLDPFARAPGAEEKLREAGVIPDDEARPYSALAAGLGKLTKK